MAYSVEARWERPLTRQPDGVGGVPRGDGLGPHHGPHRLLPGRRPRIGRRIPFDDLRELRLTQVRLAEGEGCLT